MCVRFQCTFLRKSLSINTFTHCRPDTQLSNEVVRNDAKKPPIPGLFEFWLVERTKGKYKGCAHVLCIWVEYRQKEKEAGWQGWLHECPALRIRRTVAISVSCLHSCTQTPHNASMRAISNSYPPTTHALQSPREHSVHNTPTRARHPHHSGQKKEKPGELGTRGDHVYPRLYVLDEPRFLPSSPQRGEYSTGWVICQHKSRKKVKRCILRTTLRRTETNQTSFFTPGMSLRIAPAAAAMRYAPTT